MPALIITFIYSLACLGIGHLCFFLLSTAYGKELDGTSVSIRLAVCFLLGVLILSMLLTLLGLVGMLRLIPVIGLMLAGFIAFLICGRSRIYPILSSFLAWLGSWRGEPWLIKSTALLVFLVILGFAAGAVSFPPIGDAEAYYLTYAKVMASSGRLVPMPGMYGPFSTIGMPAELHFAALIILQGVPAAKLFVWPIAIAAGILVCGIAEQAGAGRKGRLFALAILFSSNTFTNYIFDGKVDLFAAAYGLAAIYIVIGGIGNLRVALPGLFAGAATVAKFSYLPTLGCAVAVLLWWQCSEGKWYLTREAMKKLFSVAVQAAGWFLLAWMHQLLKNSILFSAPLAPFIGAEGINYLNQVWFDPSVTQRIVLTYPLALVFGRYPMQGGGLSLLMVAFLPLLFFYRKFSWKSFGPLFAITLAGIAATIFWVAIRPSVIAPRYFLAPLFLLIPVIAIAAENTWNRSSSKLVHFAIVSTIALAFVLPVYQLRGTLLAIPNLLAGEKQPCIQASEYCAPLFQLNSVADKGDRIYFAGYYSFWLRPDLLQCLNAADEMTDLENSSNMLEALHSSGFRYIVIDRSSHTEIYHKLLESVAARTDVKKLVATINFEVYELPAPSLDARRCVEIRGGEWKLTSPDYYKIYMPT
jgi:hypothetical protein